MQESNVPVTHPSACKYLEGQRSRPQAISKLFLHSNPLLLLASKSNLLD